MVKKYVVSDSHNFNNSNISNILNNSNDILKAFDLRGWYLYHANIDKRNLFDVISEGPGRQIIIYNKTYMDHYLVLPKTERPDHAIKVLLDIQEMEKMHRVKMEPIITTEGKNIPFERILFRKDIITLISKSEGRTEVNHLPYDNFVPLILYSLYPDLSS
ncbi:hypothetical protein HYW75_00665 [Candidatus Pacearchaeota archaeon]|nr:hypothetical protein [Candidatus Pacearchaeota archaeon]